MAIKNPSCFIYLPYQNFMTEFSHRSILFFYWKSQRNNDHATFELYFRKNPFKGEYTIFGGLSEALKSERPDVDKRRVDLLKLQGEYQLKLRHLEQKLLQTLNEAEGKILDDDRIIQVLEKLKTEAADVAVKAKETDGVMLEINKVSNQYNKLASACASIFFMLESLSGINDLYQFSLKFFLDIFNFILTTQNSFNNFRF